MMLTGPTCSELEEGTAFEIVSRICHVYLNKPIECLLLSWVQQFISTHQLKSFKKEDFLSLIQTIDRISKMNNDMGEEAKEIATILNDQNI